MFLFCIFVILPSLLVLLRIAFVTLFERKILALRQSRVGPNKILLKGILQPLLDGIKLLCKELVLPTTVLRTLLFLSSSLVIVIIILFWSCLLSTPFHASYWVTFFMFIVVLSIRVYGTFLIGFARTSKYSFIGAIRSCRQTVRYEVRFSLIILCTILTFGGTEFFNRSILTYLVLSPWLISCLSETNRAPFDFAEGERELIRGFNIELRSFILAYVLVAEYGILLALSWFSRAILFRRSLISALLFIFLFLTIRTSFPRLRYDKLISLCWSRILPVALFSALLLMASTIL